MSHLALVSKGWNRIVSDITQEYTPRTLKWHFKTGNRDELELFVEKIKLMGDDLRDLRLPMRIKGSWCESLGSLEDIDIDALRIDWERAFHGCQKLLRLDLLLLPLDSSHVSAVLDATSCHCPDLQSLVLPDTAKGDNLEIRPEATLAKLYEALQRWYSAGSSKGVLQLTVPRRLDTTQVANVDFTKETDEYLDAVARFCPNLEYFDGWKFIAPLDNDFLKVFAKYLKPLLRSMILAYQSSMNWDESWVEGVCYQPSGFCFSSDGLAKMLEACPALMFLEVLLGQNYQTQLLMDAIGDDFLASLTVHCKNLEELVIDDADTMEMCCSMENLTDNGLVTVSKLPWLRELRLRANRGTARGILALLANIATPQDRRSFSLDVGCSHWPSRVNFFDVLLDFLQQLADLPKEILCQHH
ncbi:hypothetical protein FI667_g4406, partial [Globisporangium splendens]